MRWREGRRSDNVEDMRGAGGGMGGGGFKLGIGGLVLAAAAYFLGVDPRLIMGIMQGAQGEGTTLESGPVETSRPADEAGDFSSAILASTEDVWTEIFAASGARYTPPRLRLYQGGTRSGCGSASAEAGPFYCPADRRVYIDPAFFDELEQRFQAPGEFARAYVIAHEVGHHVQMLTGISDKVRAAQERGSQEQQNALQVRMELQADCYAGIWAQHSESARKWLDSGDIESALTAAAAVGDDMIQRRTQGHVVPDSFTHGSAAQRQRWFSRGLATGEVKDCDTFGAPSL